MPKSTSDKRSKNKKNKGKNLKDEEFKPYQQNAQKEKRREIIDCDTFISRHFSPDHAHSNCKECQEMAKSPSVLLNLKNSNCNPNVINYLKQKYPPKTLHLDFKLRKNRTLSLTQANSTQDSSSPFNPALLPLPPKITSQILHKGIHFQEPKSGLLASLRNEIEGINPKKAENLSVDQILLNQLYKDRSIKHSLAERLGQAVHMGTVQKVEKMGIPEQTKSLILGKTVGKPAKTRKLRKESRPQSISVVPQEISSDGKQKLRKQRNPLKEEMQQVDTDKKLEIKNKFRQKSDERKKEIIQRNKEFRRIKDSSPLFVKFQQTADERDEKELTEKLSILKDHQKDKITPLFEVKKQISAYNDQKSKLIAKLRMKRLSENPKSRSITDPKLFTTKLRSRTLAMDKKLATLTKLQKEESNNRIKKRRVYADSVRRLIPVEISEQKKKEMEILIKEQMKPARDKIKKLIKNKSYFTKPRLKKASPQMQSENTSNFYENPNSETKSIQDLHADLKLVPSTQENRKLNQDLSNKAPLSRNKNTLQPAYLRTYGTTDKVNRTRVDLRSSTPEYTFKVPKYKSKLWKSNFMPGESSSPMEIKENASLIEKSMELERRVRMRELKNPSTTGSQVIKDSEEVNEMLIDSILYKVEFLNNL
ncbi:unnamed protein product [Moneuplotes crassus]|uniref:Uncharacterized protein n=1 Tax=Euplotes crassus TaxID=5936 RepID=A0AAD1U358_EUPCR|nr:unnamed protein product [Moneuplotes crassus]